jgi:hypothetical protein
LQFESGSYCTYHNPLRLEVFWALFSTRGQPGISLPTWLPVLCPHCSNSNEPKSTRTSFCNNRCGIFAPPPLHAGGRSQRCLNWAALLRRCNSVKHEHDAGAGGIVSIGQRFLRRCNPTSSSTRLQTITSLNWAALLKALQQSIISRYLRSRRR